MSKQTECIHYITEEVDDGYYDLDGEWLSNYKLLAKSTYVDLDLHRFKCTQCGLIRYYSKAGDVL